MKRWTVKRCSCDHRVQDELYGPGRRAHNAMHGNASGARGGRVEGWRCTVCGNEKRRR